MLVFLLLRVFYLFEFLLPSFFLYEVNGGWLIVVLFSDVFISIIFQSWLGFSCKRNIWFYLLSHSHVTALVRTLCPNQARGQVSWHNLHRISAGPEQVLQLLSCQTAANLCLQPGEYFSSTVWILMRSLCWRPSNAVPLSRSLQLKCFTRL